MSLTRAEVILLSSLSIILAVEILPSLLMFSFVLVVDDADSFNCIEILIWPK